MIGDQSDMLRRLKTALPLRWFDDDTPVLDGLLAGLASVWAWLYELLAGVRLQTRIATAVDTFLDLIAQDFFGSRITRRVAESDDVFRARIGRELLRERATRAAVVSVLTDLTGRPPVIFEPARPIDTGAYGVATGYGVAGGWGSLALPFQCFVTAFRPQGTGIASVTGYGQAGGGYGQGAIEYADLSMIESQVTDADINAAIAGVMPVAAVAWTCISN